MAKHCVALHRLVLFIVSAFVETVYTATRARLEHRVLEPPGRVSRPDQRKGRQPPAPPPSSPPSRFSARTPSPSAIPSSVLKELQNHGAKQPKSQRATDPPRGPQRPQAFSRPRSRLPSTVPGAPSTPAVVHTPPGPSRFCAVPSLALDLTPKRPGPGPAYPSRPSPLFFSGGFWYSC